MMIFAIVDFIPLTWKHSETGNFLGPQEDHYIKILPSSYRSIFIFSASRGTQGYVFEHYKKRVFCVLNIVL